MFFKLGLNKEKSLHILPLQSLPLLSLHDLAKEYQRRREHWFAPLLHNFSPHTAKKQYQKFETNIPRKVPFSIFCERFIYIPTNWSACFAAGKFVDRSWEYIKSLRTHECGYWD